MKRNYKDFIIVLYILEILKNILIKDLKILIKDLKVENIGHVLFKKSYYFDSFCGQPDKLLLNQSPKPIIYHNYKIQYMNSNLCGSYCLYFFYLIETMNYYDIVLKK